MMTHIDLDLAVFVALVGAAQQIADAPDKIGQLAMGFSVHLWFSFCLPAYCQKLTVQYALGDRKSFLCVNRSLSESHCLAPANIGDSVRDRRAALGEPVATHQHQAFACFNQAAQRAFDPLVGNPFVDMVVDFTDG